MDHWWILWLLVPNNSSPGPRKVNLFILDTMLKLNIFAQKKPQFYFVSKLQFLAKIHINLLKSINNSFNIEMVQTRSPFYPVDICKGCVCVCVEECSYLHWVWSFSKYTVDLSISSKKKKIDFYLDFYQKSSWAPSQSQNCTYFYPRIFVMSHENIVS